MSLSAGRVGVQADQVDSHGRVISPSFLNEIMEDLPEWTDLPVRVNGTEQLIPSNPSVPVTSPILADIDYPDERRNDQYFTYRESPTSVDGLAKIKGIKGNTLVWNQLVNTSTTTITLTSGHKFITKVGGTYSLVNGTGQSLSVTGGTDEVFDLTIMFGSGNEPNTVEGFTSLFPLPYYAYNSGSLLSFNGTEIKTVGKNQFNAEAIVTSSGHSSYVYIQDGYLMFNTGSINTNNIHWDNLNLPCPLTFKGSIKNFATSSNAVQIIFDLSDGTTSVVSFTSAIPSSEEYTFNKVIGASGKEVIRIRGAYTDSKQAGINLSTTQLEFGSVATDFEPYASSTTNLPTLTYFPTGMKSAGSVYDELIPTKAITRVGAVDLGSVEWMYNGSRFNATIVNLSQEDKRLKGLCAKYPTFNGSVADAPDKSLIFSNTTNAIYIKDSSYSDTTTFKSAMSGVYLFYELATPVELPILSFE